LNGLITTTGVPYEQWNASHNLSAAIFVAL